MPRPTNAQVAYGSLTVVLFTFVLLLLTDARSGAAVVGVATGGLALGLLVATGVAAAQRSRRVAAATASPAPPARTEVSVARTRPRVGGLSAERRVREHSLRR